MAYEIPSTLAPNPLKEGMARIMGQDPLSQTAGTSDLLSYQDNAGARLPASDVIAITGDPGTGASTAETWAHEIALENQKRDLAQFQWQQEQANLQNAISQASERRAADMYNAQVQALNYSNQLAQQEYGLRQEEANRQAAKEAREARQFYLTTEEPITRFNQASYNQAMKNQFMGGRPMTMEGDRQYSAYLAGGGRGSYDPIQAYNMTFGGRGTQQMPGQITSW
jgi:hypothetical protein